MAVPGVRWEKRGPIAHIVIDRQEKGNRIGARVLALLQDACQAIEPDNEVRVVLLWAQGPDFCLGWDWEEMEERLLPSSLTHAFDPLAELPRPVVCAVQGRCLGAGLELALACDVRLCAPDARFAFPEAGMGLLPLAGGTQRLARAVGRSWATYMLFTGAEVDASWALQMGLVSQVAQEGRLLEAAEALCRRIAERGPIAVRYAKEAIARGTEMPLEQALRYEMDLTVILQTTADRAEGVRAFLEKRRPHFTGT